MFKNKIWAILLAFALIFVFAGCGSTADEQGTTVEEENSTQSDVDKADPLVGTWRVENVLETGTSTLDYTFDENGDFTLYETFATGQQGEGIDETSNESGTGKGTYTVSGDKLTVHFNEISSEGITYEGHKLSADLNGSDTEYTYTLDGDKLTLKNTDGTEETLTKVATDTAQDQAEDAQGETSTPSNE